jgi:hypothetical protein
MNYKKNMNVFNSFCLNYKFYKKESYEKKNKKYIISFLVALAIVGCSALVSVGDHNTNSYTDNKNLNYKKDEK